MSRGAESHSELPSMRRWSRTSWCSRCASSDQEHGADILTPEFGDLGRDGVEDARGHGLGRQSEGVADLPVECPPVPSLLRRRRKRTGLPISGGPLAHPGERCGLRLRLALHPLPPQQPNLPVCDHARLRRGRRVARSGRPARPAGVTVAGHASVGSTAQQHAAIDTTRVTDHGVRRVTGRHPRPRPFVRRAPRAR